MVEDANGKRRPLNDAERSKPENIDSNWHPFQHELHFTQRVQGNKTAREFAGRRWTIPAGSWRYSLEGLDRRLGDAGRIIQERTVISAIRYFDDFSSPRTNSQLDRYRTRIVKILRCSNKSQSLSNAAFS